MDEQNNTPQVEQSIVDNNDLEVLITKTRETIAATLNESHLPLAVVKLILENLLIQCR